MAGHTTEVAKYLSQEWLDDLDRAAQATDLVRAVAPDLVFVVEHEVTEAPGGHRPLSHRVRSGHGAAATRARRRVLMRASPRIMRTAVAVSSGEINAQSAFMTGRLRVRGDMEKLIAAQPAIEALDKALEDARARTTYA